MRDLTRVIEFICREVIPPHEVALAQALKRINIEAAYIPPESQARLWRLTCELLYQNVGLPEGEPWKIRLGNVFNDKEQIPKEWKE